LLVSSKTMVAQPSVWPLPTTTPQFLAEATQLQQLLVAKSPGQLQKLMHISANLAEATHKKIMEWQPTGGTPAWYAFVGDVYKGLKIAEFTKEDLAFAQLHMATISGIYGLTRPMDLIYPYRLELMYKFSGKGFKNLYEFWGNKIALTIPKNEPVINLSSEEYIKVLRPYLPKEQIITPWFMQMKNGQPDFQVIHAKIARGTMARWIAQNKVDSPVLLEKFDYDNYKFNTKLSTPTKPVFVR